MAKLTRPHSCEEMNVLAGAFNKQLDFYFWKGIPCVRKWPKWNRDRMSLDQIAASAAFQNGVQLKATILPQIRDNFKAVAAGTTQTWADVLMVNAMAYYTAGLGYAPALTAVDVTYGSGIKSITLWFNYPCAPVLQFYRGLRPVSYEKRFRGKKTKCKKPNQVLGAIAYPMELDFDHAIAIPLSRAYVSKGSKNILWSYPSCASALAAAVSEYNNTPLPWPDLRSANLIQGGSMWENKWAMVAAAEKETYSGSISLDSVWEADIDGNCIPRDDLTVGFYGAFEVNYPWCFMSAEAPKLDTYFEVVGGNTLVQWEFAPFLISDINGISFLAAGHIYWNNPGGDFIVQVSGGPDTRFPVGTFSSVKTLGFKMPGSGNFSMSSFHEQYPAMAIPPVCAIPGYNKHMEGYFNTSNIYFTIGNTWQYTFTFPRPLKPGIDIYCSFVDARGNMVLMYPVTVTYKGEDGNGWGELMADPYEEE